MPSQKGYVANKKAQKKLGVKKNAKKAAQKGSQKAKIKAKVGCAAIASQIPMLAKKYAKFTNANVPFTWNHILPGLNSGAQSKIRNYAKDNNLVIKGNLDPNQNYGQTPPPPPPSFVIFPSSFIKNTQKLPKTMFTATDSVQFTWLDNNLKKLDSTYNPKTQTFGNNPTKYTWHHAQDPPGTMELVEFGIHNRTSHAGGRNVWGGGTGSR